MSVVNVLGVEVGENPAPAQSRFRFEVTFECLERLDADLEWKVVYVGSAEDKSLDQELDCVVMGPIHRGALKFAFDADAPDFAKIPPDDIVGFTIILLTGSYRDEEFVRIGWYVHNSYTDPQLAEDPPEVPVLEKMHRLILTDAPRVTRFKVSWDDIACQQAATALQPQDADVAGGVLGCGAAGDLQQNCNPNSQAAIAAVDNGGACRSGVFGVGGTAPAQTWLPSKDGACMGGEGFGGQCDDVEMQ